MTPLCNDQLTRVRQPHLFRFTEDVPIERVIRVGDKGMRGSTPYTVKAFGVNSYTLRRIRQGDHCHAGVWMMVKMRGWRNHAWLALMIGDTSCFREKLVLGGPHPNPVFDGIWPKDWMQPFGTNGKLLKFHYPKQTK